MRAQSFSRTPSACLLARLLAHLLACLQPCSHAATQPGSPFCIAFLPHLLARLLACLLTRLLACFTRSLACLRAGSHAALSYYMPTACSPFLFVCPPLCFETWLRSLVCSLSRSLCLLARLPACSPCSPFFVCLPLSFFCCLPASLSLLSIA